MEAAKVLDITIFRFIYIGASKGVLGFIIRNITL
jgi:hypothetical protein